MKKILLSLLMVLACTSAVFAEDEDELAPLKSTAPSSARLVDMESRRVSSKLDDLERRLKELERSQRMLEDRVRNLDRTVSDVKRRTV